jgi:hypothetical protein
MHGPSTTEWIMTGRHGEWLRDHGVRGGTTLRPYDDLLPNGPLGSREAQRTTRTKCGPLCDPDIGKVGPVESSDPSVQISTF